jgi:hypothetical protein
VDGISAALNTSTHIKPQLSVSVTVENAPDPEAGHRIIKTYLGRDRYLEHMAHCLEKKRSDNHSTNAQLDRIVARLIHLSAEQQQALKPLQDRLREMNSFVGVQALDEKGALFSLDDRPQMDIPEELQELLSLAEHGFSILTEDQARAYRDLATGTAYSEVLSQYKLTESFLPIPEQVRELIKSNEAIRRLNEQEEAQQQETTSRDN